MRIKTSFCQDQTFLTILMRHYKLISATFAIGLIGFIVVHIISLEENWPGKAVATLWIVISFLATFYVEQCGWVISSRTISRKSSKNVK